jgi:cobalt/nickel transport system permease protein
MVVYDADNRKEVGIQLSSIPVLHFVRRSGFIERTLADINHILEQSLFAEQIARQQGLLQKLDPRLKILATLLLLVSVNLSHNLIVIVALYLLTLVLARSSRVPLAFFIMRVWVLIPFFTGLVALPALFITPGIVLMRLPFGLVVTQSGCLTALFLLLRVGTSASMAVLLVLTTPWNNVLKALGILHIPAVVVLIFGMTFRYIHLLLNITNDMFLSRKSRLLRRMPGPEGRRLLAATVGTLLNKSLQVSGEVYLAMQSRGFRNYPRTLDTFQMKTTDWVAGMIVVIIAGAAIWYGR